MTAPLSARKRLREFVAQRETLRGLDPDHVTAANHAPLLLSDLLALLDAFDAPCGSCHPCDHWAAETWRSAGGKLPHKYVVDEMRASLDRVESLAASLIHPWDNVTGAEIRAAITPPDCDPS